MHGFFVWTCENKYFPNPSTKNLFVGLFFMRQSPQLDKAKFS